MSKIDNIFLKVISDEKLVNTFDIQPGKYSTLDDGKRAMNPHVRAIAEILAQLYEKINEVQSDMRIRNKVGPVVLNDADFQFIYKKVVSSLSK